MSIFQPIKLWVAVDMVHGRETQLQVGENLNGLTLQDKSLRDTLG